MNNNQENTKFNFAATLADTVYKGMSDCEAYGMTWGCDMGCPVLQSGNCQLKDDENKELYKAYLQSIGEEYEE